MARFDHTLPKEGMKTIYNKQLMDAYMKRGDWYSENNLLVEALGDYEQVYLFKLREMDITEIQVYDLIPYCY